MTDDKRPAGVRRQVQAALERLQEDEALTSTLDEGSARLLLAWAETRLQTIERLEVTDERRRALIDELFIICRSVNCLNQARRQMGNLQFVSQVLGMLDSVDTLCSWPDDDQTVMNRGGGHAQNPL